MEAYQGLLATVAVGLAASLVWLDTRMSPWWIVLGLALVAAIAERGRVKLARNIEASISLIPTVFAATVLGPLAAMIVAAVSMSGEFPPLLSAQKRADVYARGRPYLKWGIYTCIRSISGGAAGLMAENALQEGGGPGAVALATVAATLVAAPLDLALTALTFRLRGGRAWDVVSAVLPAQTISIPLYTPVVVILALAYTQVSTWTLPFFLVPALGAQRLFSLYQHERELTEELADANGQLERANLSFASALVATLDARDRYTAGHSAAVAIYGRDIARRLGLSEQDQQLAHLCGLVHDIGKVGLPAGLLEKPGALTLEERRVMETHSEIGERILSKVDTYSEIAAVVRHHHERIDGQGYPDGLADEAIPLLSRIIAVADAYNAMTSDRPYRDAMPSRVARVRLAQAIDSQFDTGIVAAFEAILVGATEEYRCGLGPAFQWVARTEVSKHELGAVYSSA
jgi:putative nucleotidyltransferase with HDIG domain